MILVDTSVWIELLNGRLARAVAPDDLVQFVTCGPVVQEVLQGLREGPASDGFRGAFLALPRLSDPLLLSVFLEAAEIYRLGRRKGCTIRSSTDCLIAAIAIQNRVPVWHKDRDYTAIARFTGLETLNW
jgi:predicted nucleic acid-binding protein